MDPRKAAIDFQLRNIKRVVAVSGCKGGIGKSMVSTTLSLMFAKKGLKAGLLDLDFFSPSDHLILGSKGKFPEEEKGLVPDKIQGVEFMSLIHFVEDRAVPLRGTEVSDAIIELLAITAWGELDFLIIDMPPGLSDAVLEIIRSIPKIEFLLVSTPSKLSWESARKMASILKEIKVPIIGLIENMSRKTQFIQIESEKMGLKFLGSLPFDESLEEKIGFPEQLTKTGFAEQVSALTKKCL